MHYHLEILMPPTKDIKKAVSEIMAPFNEDFDDEDGGRPQNTFWDWWEIGGRWSGNKIEARVGQKGIDAFYKELADRNVTVSGLQWGKPELQPTSQIEMVDALWNEMFPNSGIKSCPLFKHTQVDDDLDVCTLSEVPEGLTASRVIVAGPDRHIAGQLRAAFMIEDNVWNGVTWVDTDWDGLVRSAVDRYIKETERYTADYKEAHQPKPDWVLVTVDYHS